MSGSPGLSHPRDIIPPPGHCCATMEQGRRGRSQSSQAPHHRSSTRDRTPQQTDPRGPRPETSDQRRSRDRSRSCDTVGSRPRDEQAGKKNKRDNWRTSGLKLRVEGAKGRPTTPWDRKKWQEAIVAMAQVVKSAELIKNSEDERDRKRQRREEA